MRDGVAFPDTLVGTDSHTTMINGLGVLGWGVGGIEAEAAMLGQPMFLPQPVGGRRARHGRAAARDDRDRPRPDADADAPRARGRRTVRRVLRRRAARRSTLADRATLVEHVPRVRGHGRVLCPVDERDARVPPVHRSRRPGRPGRALHEGAGAVPHATATRARPSPRSLDLDLAAVEPSWPDRSGRRTASRCRACGTRSSRRSATGSSPTPTRPRSAGCSRRAGTPETAVDPTRPSSRVAGAGTPQPTAPSGTARSSSRRSPAARTRRTRR